MDGDHAPKKKLQGSRNATLDIYIQQQNGIVVLFYRSLQYFSVFLSVFAHLRSSSVLKTTKKNLKLCILTCLYNCKSLFRACVCVYCKSQCDTKEE